MSQGGGPTLVILLQLSLQLASNPACRQFLKTFLSIHGRGRESLLSEKFHSMEIPLGREEETVGSLSEPEGYLQAALDCWYQRV